MGQVLGVAAMLDKCWVWPRCGTSAGCGHDVGQVLDVAGRGDAGTSGAEVASMRSVQMMGQQNKTNKQTNKNKQNKNKNKTQQQPKTASLIDYYGLTTAHKPHHGLLPHRPHPSPADGPRSTQHTHGSPTALHLTGQQTNKRQQPKTIPK